MEAPPKEFVLPFYHTNQKMQGGCEKRHKIFPLKNWEIGKKPGFVKTNSVHKLFSIWSKKVKNNLLTFGGAVVYCVQNKRLKKVKVKKTEAFSERSDAGGYFRSDRQLPAGEFGRGGERCGGGPAQ
jgi:hypothetical protein